MRKITSETKSTNNKYQPMTEITICTYTYGLFKNSVLQFVSKVAYFETLNLNLKASGITHKCYMIHGYINNNKDKLETSLWLYEITTYLDFYNVFT